MSSENPAQRFQDIHSMGDMLRHAYDGVDTGVLWDAVKTELPPLKAACEKALTKLEDGNS